MKLTNLWIYLSLSLVIFSVYGQPIQFSVFEVQIPQGRIIYLNSLNDSGFVSGRIRPSDSDINVVYDFENLKVLPFLSGYDRAGDIFLNNAGQVGGTHSSLTSAESRGFLNTNGTMTNVGTLGGTHTIITGINNSGAMSGYSGVADPFPYHAILYENGNLRDLGTIAHDFSRGFDLNNKNEVVGWSNVVSGENNIYHAFIYRNNAMEDLGILAGDNTSQAYAINDSSYVVGSSGSRAFVWYGQGSMEALPVVSGTTQSMALDINNQNIITGRCYTNSGSIPVIWVDGEVYNLNNLLESGTSVGDILAINNKNQLLCNDYSSGTSRWFILSPVNNEFIVNVPGDEADFDLTDEVADIDPDTPGDQTTLRAAIQQANYNSGKNKIIFNIPGSTEPVIQVHSPLPVINETLEIDGTTQIGKTVQISGSSAGSHTNGIVIQADNCLIQGLSIHSFQGSGIIVQNGSKNALYGNIIGTDPNSATGKGNGENGITIADGSDNIIGSQSSNQFNIIAGNAGSGVFITGENATQNWVKSNYIGTDTTGVEGLGNGNAGVEISDAGEGNQVGMKVEKSASLKSANITAINIQSGNIIAKSLNNIIVRNTIGTQISGNLVGLFKKPGSETYKAMGSLLEAIKIDNAQSTEISDVFAAAAGSHGIRITGPGSKYNKIFNVTVGTDPNGSEGLGCAGSGICIDSLASENTLGGCDSLIRLVQNQQYALQVINSYLNKVNAVQAGIIRNLGTNRLDSKSANISIGMGNLLGGMHFLNASQNQVGDSCAQNIIAANQGPGMVFEGDSTLLNIIRANIIGTDETGAQNLGNRGDGMLFKNGAQQNTIGGNHAKEANMSVANDGSGFAFVGTTQNEMLNNLSGLFGDPNGILKNMGNLQSGVLVKNSSKMTIHKGFFGGNKYGVRISGQNAMLNKISGIFAGTDSLITQSLGNKLYGILVDSLAHQNRIGGMGVDSTVIVGGNEEAGIKLQLAKRNQLFNTLSGVMQKFNESSMQIIKNMGPGIVLEDSEENELGAPDMPNVVAGNSEEGILITGAVSSLNKIMATFVGTTQQGQAGLGNSKDGVKITDGATQNTIGGLAEGEQVVSASNGGSGFFISGRALENLIQGCTSGIVKNGQEPSIPLANKTGFTILNAQKTQILQSVFAANLQEGGVISGSDARENKVDRCWFGTDSTFAENLGNLQGLQILNGARQNVIGAGGRNYFSGNLQWGLILKNADENQVMNNVIGALQALQIPLQNRVGGIKVENGTNNVLGRPQGGRFGVIYNFANFIQGHDSTGVAIINSTGTQLNGNEIVQNRIGVMVRMTEVLDSTLRNLNILQNKIIQNLRAFEGTNSDIYLAGNHIVENTGVATGIHLFHTTGIIYGNLISGDVGDGIALEDQSNPYISFNNIVENGGYGLHNMDEDVTVHASGNWWGNSDGPGGNGPGSGDEVSTWVDYQNWQTAFLPAVAFFNSDTLFAPPGQDTVEVYLSRFLPGNETIQISISDSESWISDRADQSVSFTGNEFGAVLPVMVGVPGGTSSLVNPVTVTLTLENTGITVYNTLFLKTYQPQIKRLQLEADTLFIHAGSVYQFIANAYDQFDNLMAVNLSWETNAGTIDASGLFTAPNEAGTYYILVKDALTQITDSAVVIVQRATENMEATLPAFLVSQNYPNPFASHAVIDIQIAEPSDVEISLWDLQGRKIRQMVSGHFDAGAHQILLEAHDIPSGTYIYESRIGNQRTVHKCIVRH